MSFLKNRTVVGVICILLSLLICFGLTPLFNQSVSQKAEIVRVESVDEKDKTCSVRGTFFTMEKVPLHYVLGRYNPAVGEEHYGVRGIVPFFCEDKELAGYYLNEVRTMWDVEMGEEQDLSM